MFLSFKKDKNYMLLEVASTKNTIK